MKITSKTGLLGLFGNPSRHSLSPLIQNHFILKYGLDYVYLSFEPEQESLRDAFNGAKSLDFKGINVTMPFKEQIFKMLDFTGTTASITRSVNTVLFDKSSNSSTGFSTDGSGMVKALEDKDFSWEGKNCFIIGAGGAAKSALYSLYKKPLKKIYIYDIEYDRSVNMLNTMVAGLLRTGDEKPVRYSADGSNGIYKNNEFAGKKSASGKNINKKIKKIYNKTAGAILEEIDCRFKLLSDISDIEKEFDTLDLIINCTPAGMDIPGISENVKKCPLPLSWGLKGKYIFDMVYKPAETVLIKKAINDGAAAVIGGIDMLINQAAYSFKIWFDILPDKSVTDEVKKIVEKNFF